MDPKKKMTIIAKEDVITKNKVKAAVLFKNYIVEGTLHVYMNQRYSDFLNKYKKDFLAITNAKVFLREEQKMLYKSKFLSINKNSIDCIVFK